MVWNKDRLVWNKVTCCRTNPWVSVSQTVTSCSMHTDSPTLIRKINPYVESVIYKSRCYINDQGWSCLARNLIISRLASGQKCLNFPGVNADNFAKRGRGRPSLSAMSFVYEETPRDTEQKVLSVRHAKVCANKPSLFAFLPEKRTMRIFQNTFEMR